MISAPALYKRDSTRQRPSIAGDNRLCQFLHILHRGRHYPRCRHCPEPFILVKECKEDRNCDLSQGLGTVDAKGRAYLRLLG